MASRPVSSCLTAATLCPGLLRNPRIRLKSHSYFKRLSKASHLVNLSETNVKLMLFYDIIHLYFTYEIEQLTPLTVKIVEEIVVPFELKNAVSNYPLNPRIRLNNLVVSLLKSFLSKKKNYKKNVIIAVPLRQRFLRYEHLFTLVTYHTYRSHLWVLS